MAKDEHGFELDSNVASDGTVKRSNKMRSDAGATSVAHDAKNNSSAEARGIDSGNDDVMDPFRLKPTGGPMSFTVVDGKKTE